MAHSTVKATISYGDKTIIFEGPREFVEAQVARYTAADISSHNQVTGDKGAPLPGEAVLPSGERELIQAKRPANHSETVAVLAFALTQQGKAEFSEEDIRRAYIRAGVRPPKVVGQAIRDAKNNFDFIENAGERGSYRLTNHGDRTVRFDLPRSA